MMGRAAGARCIWVFADYVTVDSVCFLYCGAPHSSNRATCRGTGTRTHNCKNAVDTVINSTRLAHLTTHTCDARTVCGGQHGTESVTTLNP